MNPTASNKVRSECPGELLKRINRTYSQAIKPHHCHMPQIGWEYLAHQGLIFGVQIHSLVEVAYMLYRVCSTIVHGECWLSKPLRKSSSFNSACER